MKTLLPFTRPTIDEETIQAVAEVLRSGWLASGPKVAELEAALSRYLGGRPVRTQTSATAGLEMALQACGGGGGGGGGPPPLLFFWPPPTPPAGRWGRSTKQAGRPPSPPPP